jgi:hypothetical protein
MISIKKIMSVIAIAFAVMTIAGSGVLVNAAPGVAPVDPCSTETGKTAPGCQAGFFKNIFDGVGAGGLTGIAAVIAQVGFFLVGVIAAVSVLFLILGAFDMVSDSGDGKKFANGKTRITNAIIGLVVALLAFAIVSVVIRVIK